MRLGAPSPASGSLLCDRQGVVVGARGPPSGPSSPPTTVPPRQVIPWERGRQGGRYDRMASRRTPSAQRRPRSHGSASDGRRSSTEAMALGLRERKPEVGSHYRRRRLRLGQVGCQPLQPGRWVDRILRSGAPEIANDRVLGGDQCLQIGRRWRIRGRNTKELGVELGESSLDRPSFC